MPVERVCLHNANTIHSAATNCSHPPTRLIAIQASLANEAVLQIDQAAFAYQKVLWQFKVFFDV